MDIKIKSTSFDVFKHKYGISDGPGTNPGRPQNNQAYIVGDVHYSPPAKPEIDEAEDHPWMDVDMYGDAESLADVNSVEVEWRQKVPHSHKEVTVTYKFTIKPHDSLRSRLISVSKEVV